MTSPASAPAAAEPAVRDLLRRAADCARGGVDVREAGGAPVPLASAPACERCRRLTPAFHVRCQAVVRPRLGTGESHLCAHGQGIRAAAGGQLLAVAPAGRVARFAALLESLVEMAGPAHAAGEPVAAPVLDSTVKSLIAAVDAKDPYTRGHSERVHIAATLLGDAVGLDPGARADLYWGSLLHDVGKIGAPDHILKKPGKLTAEEYRVMQEHPARGDEMLVPLAWLAGARRGVRHHHERVDGAGYPDGLAGESIPLIARLIAVADTFDAVTSRRAYRGERGLERALDVLEEAAGTQLDPALVRLFVRHAGRIEAALLAASIPPEGLLAPPEAAAGEALRPAA